MHTNRLLVGFDGQYTTKQPQTYHGSQNSFVFDSSKKTENSGKIWVAFYLSSDILYITVIEGNLDANK